ncbi:MAG: DNA adenine methylase [Succinivibrionaceae bacterium]|nr:DNA adenine methylase [Succinivibrionaceae bacterium]MEE1339356.1 DNA adenine methylase [Succinivibrionaceae bacterium]
MEELITPKLVPFVKWAGGKRQLLKQLEDLMPLSYDRYFEPFVGGGALFFDITPQSAVINDINPQLINVYNQIKNNLKELIAIIKYLDSGEITKETYFSLREIYNQKILNKSFDTFGAALTIWINKHCFNGLYRVNKAGLFNVPFNNKTNISSIDEDNLVLISDYLNTHDIKIMQVDFEESLKEVKKGDFVYFDSPYFPLDVTAKFTEYTQGGFSLESHYRLADTFKRLDKMGIKLMLSNNDVKEVYELYGDFNINHVNVSRAINSDATARKGKELIITNY